MNIRTLAAVAFGIFVCSLAGRSEGPSGPLLLDPSPEQRLAAHEESAAGWDYDAPPELIALENDTDPQVRRRARQLVRRYHIWGPHRPTWQQRRDADPREFQPYDRTGLRSWRRRGFESAGLCHAPVQRRSRLGQALIACPPCGAIAPIQAARKRFASGPARPQGPVTAPADSSHCE